MRPYLTALMLSLAVTLTAGCADQATGRQRDIEIKALTEKIAALTETVKALESKPPSRPGIGTLAEQEQCSRQAAIAFHELDNKEGPGSRYQNHFSTSTGRCFIAIINKATKPDKSTTVTSFLLFDAFELKDYASYMEQNGKAGIEVLDCHVRGADGEWTGCTKGRPEFDAFVKLHMTQ
jgi:hypothetical protein